MRRGLLSLDVATDRMSSEVVDVSDQFRAEGRLATRGLRFDGGKRRDRSFGATPLEL